MPAEDPRKLNLSELGPVSREMAQLLNRKRSREQLHFTNLEELEALAQSVLPHMIHRYYSGGADGEVTLRNCSSVWKQYRLMPRMLRDVSNVSTSCNFLGEEISMPMGIAPMAMMKMAHPDGELAVAKAASQAGVPMVVSTNGTTPLTEVRQCAPDCPAMMFQLYIYTDRQNTIRLLKDAESAGYKAICLTVDVPALSNREDDTRNDFKLPSHLHMSNLPDLEEANKRLKASGEGDNMKQMGAWHDATLTWESIPWIRTQTKLPVFLKGILDPRDALKAVEVGCDGIIISNHGGRQLDHIPTSLTMLPSISRAVNKRVPLWLDGGVRRGTDIVKAIALGADGVFIGRPIVFALALNGEEGVRRALEVIKKEFKLALMLMGCASISDLNQDCVMIPGDPYPKL